MFTLEIHTGNDAQPDGDAAALAATLRRLADRLEHGNPGTDAGAEPGMSAPVRDLNGARVGAWSWSVTA